MRTPKPKIELEAVTAIVPKPVKAIIEKIAIQEDRSTSQVVRRLLEESPRIKTALRHNGKPHAVA